MATVTTPVIQWLRNVWPEHEWQDAQVREACFHEVAVLAPKVVGRVSCHGEQAERARREHRLLELFEKVSLPFDVPRPLSNAVTHDGRTGMLTTFVAGEHRGDVEWRVAAEPIQAALAAFADATDDALTRQLPAPRTWCGGERWPHLVRRNLLPLLPRQARSLATKVVSDVLQVEEGAEVVHLVHGDFGPHNLLWGDQRIAGLLDLDHACAGDPAIDVATLISFFGAQRVGQIVDHRTLTRAMIHRASLTLQLAAAAELLGDAGLRDHALGNFVSRSQAGTLHDPGGAHPE